MAPGLPRRCVAAGGRAAWARVRTGRRVALVGGVVLASLSAACGSGGGAPVAVSEGELSAAVRGAGEVAVLLSSSGLARSCGLVPDGDVRCWGQGEGGASWRHPEGPFAAISGGEDHLCGLRLDGAVRCWRANSYAGSDVPEGVPEGAFAAVSVGGVHACGLRPDGAAECWGDGPELAVKPVVGDVAHPGGAFAAVSAGYAHACGLRPGGGVDCWGKNWSGQTDAPAGRFLAVDAGASHSCGLRPDGAIDCWGRDSVESANAMVYNYRGGGNRDEVRAGADVSDDLPLRDEALRDVIARRSAAWAPPPGPYVAVSAGQGITCGLRLDATIACWGYLHDEEPRIPLHVLEDVAGPEITEEITSARARLDETAPEDWSYADWVLDVEVERVRALLELPHPPSGRFLAVDAGSLRACGLRHDGTIECWGHDLYGAASPPPEPFATTAPPAGARPRP